MHQEAPDAVEAHLKPPQQERSRQSLERALDAAVALMVERGSDAFTLAEVAERADVSIGSIYGRVKSKDDLLRSVHARELQRIDQETVKAFRRFKREPGDLDSAAAFAVTAAAQILRKNAGILGPFMMRANSDPVIAEMGARSHVSLEAQFTTVVMSRSERVTHPNPTAAVHWTFTVVYSVIARYLGLGSSPEAAGQGDWNQMLSYLIDMTISFLTHPPAKIRRA